jgi:LPPG:FO 2-phospho-L-lactate transferase
MKGRVLALSGGVGGARMADGLQRAIGDAVLLTVCCNIGDDFDHLGLRITPDIDTVLYTLSGLADPVRGWGLRNETWNFMQGLKRVGGDAWFMLGDQDLATHVWRTERLARGHSLTEITQGLAQRMGIKARVVPVSDDHIATIVMTPDGPLAFQHYFVREQCRPTLSGLDYQGAQQARLSPIVREMLDGEDLNAIIICPSNPFLSIQPMLALQELDEALKTRRAPSIAVSPIIGGAAVKGPLAKIMAEGGHEVSSLGIARLYQGLIDGLMIDTYDEALAPAIEALGIRVDVSPTLMKDDLTRNALGERALAFAAIIAVGAN